MDTNDAVTSGTFSEEEKLHESIDEDTNWFGKNLGEESDNTNEHEVLNSHINQEDLGVTLDSVKGGDVEEGVKSSEDMLETDSQSQLLDEISSSSVEKHQVTLGTKKDELTELKDIEIDGKKHDISNELKEMFEEKSSDAEELPETETSLSKHSLDTEITKEDKLKDIVPDDILGKDDSFDELDNDDLHHELEAHLTYEKSKEVVMSDSSDANDTNLKSDPESHDKEQLDGQEENQSQVSSEPELNKSDENLNFQEKPELLKNLTDDVGTQEIDEMMDQGMSGEEDNTNKEIAEEITAGLESNCELKDELENQLENITGEGPEDVQHKQDNTESEEMVSQVDKASIELNQENMMVEFAHDSGSQVLIQINTAQSDPAPEEDKKSDQLVMETADGQTIVFSAGSADDTSASEGDVVSQVEGGAEFLQAVTGKMEDVFHNVKEEVKEDNQSPTKTNPTETKPVPSPVVVTKVPVKEDLPKCCITTCKSGKSALKTTYRYFKPPVNKLLYKKWEYIFNQAKQQLTTSSLICELHFRTGLIYKKGIDRYGKVIWALREGALPKLSPSGILRVGGIVPSPSTTVQVPKKPEIKSPNFRPIAPKPEKSPPASPPVSNLASTPKVLGKKILQKPVKTVATKVSNEVTDIGFLYKNPELVKVAQEELVNQDVLVCGECHSVFHILELFQAHKMANNCKGESNFKGNPSEPKPQVWAFLLWKSAQAKTSDVESSWRLYQRWCKMDERIRSTWIAAGKSLQEGNAIASLRLIDDAPQRNRPGRPSLKDRDSDDEDYAVPKAKKPKTQVEAKKISQGLLEPEEEVDLGGAGDASTFSESEPMEVENAYTSPAKPAEEAREVDQTLDDLARATPELLTTEVEIKQEVMSDEEDSGENKENKSSDQMQVCSRCNEPVTNPKRGIRCAVGCYRFFHVECTHISTPKNLSKMGIKRTFWKCEDCKRKDISKPREKRVQEKKPQSQSQEKDDEEFVVEKIVSRRYNIKKKHFEYLLKWEGYPSDQNTWEPAENLGTCQHLLKAFEEALAKQQAAKQAMQGKLTPASKPDFKIKPPFIAKRKEEGTPTPSSIPINTGRPVRSSKKKAMDQVKVWCGSIVRPSEYDSVGTKRKASDSDSEYEEEVVVKRVKVEMESEDSEADSIKRVTPTKGRGRPASLAKPGNKVVVNGGGKESNLAAALGLESDDDDMGADTLLSPTATPLSPKKSPAVTNMSSLSPNNQQVLVASAKGVVKVDPKQVPNLSSGVYIMSNKSGIVKVDNNKTLTSLKKTGVMRKPVQLPSKGEAQSPNKPTGGVVVLPRSEAGTNQQKIGVIRKSGVVTTSSPSASSTPSRPAGLLKPMKPGATPRPLKLLKSPTTTPGTPRPPGVTPKVQLGIKSGSTLPLRGRTPLLRKPTPETTTQVTPQQKLLIAKKKAESEVDRPLHPGKPSVTITPVVKKPLTPAVKSTNKPLAHPLLSRGRGRGFRGRGRGGSSLSQLLQVQREAAEVRESKLVESDNLLMEFQEPSDSEESDDGLEDIFPKIELPPIQPDSPPRALTLCPLTGKVLAKAEGEKTPEPTPPPSPSPPTPPPAPTPIKSEESQPTHILPDHEDEIETEETVPVAVAAVTPPAVPTLVPAPAPAPPSVTVNVTTKPVTITTSQAQAPAPAPTPIPTPRQTTTTIVKQDGMICKVEMSPGGTTGTLIEAVSENAAHVTEGTVTIKKPRSRINRGPQLSVMPSNSRSTSLGTITVPARKLFQEETGDDDMVTITGEDGLVYQVSNAELQGGGTHTLLVSSGDGDGEDQQQCVYVTTDGDGTDEGTILTLDTAYADAVAQLASDQQVNILSTESGDQFYIKEGEDGGEQLLALEGGVGVEGMVEGVGGDEQSGQVVAQLVEAGEPAPGGSRRVVLLLPDGNLMMTEVDEEQYAALDLDK